MEGQTAGAPSPCNLDRAVESPWKLPDGLTAERPAVRPAMDAEGRSLPRLFSRGLNPEESANAGDDPDPHQSAEQQTENRAARGRDVFVVRLGGAITPLRAKPRHRFAKIRMKSNSIDGCHHSQPLSPSSQQGQEEWSQMSPFVRCDRYHAGCERHLPSA